MGTPREDLAAALKQARLQAGFDSQQKLAKALHVSRPLVNKAENGNQPVPSDALLMGWADTCGCDLAELLRLAEMVKNGTPEWFTPYVSVEQVAAFLRFWGPLVIPGLLQTPAYARALLASEPRTPGQLTALVEQRIERQQVLGRARITAVIDHRVLAHCIGSPAIMAEQCGHIAALAESGQIQLYIVPEGLNTGLGGAFAVATAGGASTVALTTTIRDITSTAPDVVDETLTAFDVVLAAALSAVPSLEFVRACEARWKEQA